MAERPPLEQLALDLAQGDIRGAVVLMNARGEYRELKEKFVAALDNLNLRGSWRDTMNTVIVLGRRVEFLVKEDPWYEARARKIPVYHV